MARTVHRTLPPSHPDYPVKKGEIIRFRKTLARVDGYDEYPDGRAKLVCRTTGERCRLYNGFPFEVPADSVSYPETILSFPHPPASRRGPSRRR